MKKLIYFLIVFLMMFFNLIQLVISSCTPCCCQTASGSGQYRCYNSGICCRIGTAQEYWDPVSCYRFTAWLEPHRAAFVVGQKTPINLYIENTGVYTDSYDITYTVSDATLVLVDITGISSVKNVVPEEVRLVNPMITVIRKDHGTVDFIINSDSGLPPQSVTLTILESELPMSLPEFGLYGMSGMIILAGIIYFLIKWKH